MTAGHVMVNLRLDIGDAEAFIDAGRQSLIRKYPGKYARAEAEQTIRTVEDAASELLIEGFRSLPLEDNVADWGDIDNNEFYPREEA